MFCRRKTNLTRLKVQFVLSLFFLKQLFSERKKRRRDSSDQDDEADKKKKKKKKKKETVVPDAAAIDPGRFQIALVPKERVWNNTCFYNTLPLNREEE